MPKTSLVCAILCYRHEIRCNSRRKWHILVPWSPLRIPISTYNPRNLGIIIMLDIMATRWTCANNKAPVEISLQFQGNLYSYCLSILKDSSTSMTHINKLYPHHFPHSSPENWKWIRKGKEDRIGQAIIKYGSLCMALSSSDVLTKRK